MMRINSHPIWKYVGILGVGIGISLLMFGQLQWRSILENTLYTLVYWEGAWYITTYSRKRFQSFEETKKRIQFQALTIGLYVVSMNFVLCYAVSKLHQVGPFSWEIYWNTLRMSLFVTALITTIYEAQNFFDLWKKANVDTERLKQETLLAQFETLKTQVNPHFLFNSLNTLTAIIPEDPKLAVDFVQKLSSFYRYLLQFRDQALVSVETEVESIEAYLFLQHMRFGESLNWKLHIRQEDKSALIPPLSLQILVENVVKHNTLSRQRPMEIILQSDGKYLEVSNPLQPKRQPEVSTHIGLANISERLRLLGDHTLIIEKSATHFRVKIPLIPYENTHS